MANGLRKLIKRARRDLTEPDYTPAYDQTKDSKEPQTQARYGGLRLEELEERIAL